MPIRAVRGATTLDSNTKQEIADRTKELLDEVLNANGLSDDDLISLTFSTTPDIDAMPPAAAARDYGLTDVPLLCLAEMPVVGSLAMCVRIMLYIESDTPRSQIKHRFLRGAKVLRPDLEES